ncbi:outer membrane protein assembly factor BamA [Pusillimonas noertemannii]|uniref:Outer membrane protein assembly factor BamA n=1 Tax=Pusillimonas noertemannii TaxID=305977 RepID=A0A2U1CJP3_9BURK|nr:outer membrane protein assembly factor BamA [Pusillimonas noertemannii]NYT69864.1 outer membrane protein assembly factor BamA [Pusillimonas noertemannii]PVY61212.1 Beta-barrel assembly machine subunit BamA [Pusillimonas noertemannii]TFL09163.1 outer membrane protein assembly factor BamA [Pusillimonas noertemannii]
MSFRRKTKFTQRALPLILAAWLAPGLASAFTPFVVQDIRVNGIQRVDAGAVFSYLPVKVGDQFTEEQASEAVQRLYATGFFSDVTIDTEGNVLVVNVKERPTIASVSFNGMREFDAEALNKSLSAVGFGPGRVFDQAMLERAEFELKQQYLAKGKYGVEINPIITPLPRNRVGISFDIFEGELAKISEINFVGNEDFSSGTLRDELELTTSGFMTWYTGTDKYSREKLEGDVERIRSFYLDRGYLEFSSEQPQVAISPNREDIFVTFTIHEGEPYTLRSVKLAGELLGLDEEIGKLIQVKEGETFSAAKTNETAKAITDYLGSLGYAFANVNPNPVLDRDAHEADLTFYVDPGRRVYVNRIQIGGNTRTRDEVIRREMRQMEASWYDSTNIKMSRDRIDRLGYFNEVNVTTEPVPGSPDQIDVNVDVKEKPTGMINLGVGYGSTDKVILSAGISQDNIFGSGNSLSLQVNTSKTNRSAVIAHTDPYWTNDGISKTTSLYYRRTTPYETSSDYYEYQGDYRVTAIGAGLNFGVPISEYDRIFTGVSFERNTLDLYNPPQAYKDYVDEYGRTTNSVIFNVGWSKDTRDSALAPNKGSYTRLSADVSTMGLKYYMLHAQQQYYLPLGRSFTLAFNGTVDWGKTYGGKAFPVIKNVYAGGIGTVRGYEGASLGPRDTITGDYLGGARRIVGNVQLYLPFPGASRDRTLRWFVFADAGQVSAGSGMSCMDGFNHSVQDPCGWRYSAGVGLSWQSPMGPLELSFGRALNAREGDDKQAFQFQIGTGF